MILRYNPTCVLYLRNSSVKTVVVKGVRHPRIKNERNVLQKFQHRSIRPLIDQIIALIDPPGIVLRHLDADIMEGVPQSARKSFQHIKDKEFESEDRIFLLKVMKLDPRDRPTAEQLLQDDWFS